MTQTEQLSMQAPVTHPRRFLLVLTSGIVLVIWRISGEMT